jgi:hypothetical protein
MYVYLGEVDDTKILHLSTDTISSIFVASSLLKVFYPHLIYCNRFSIYTVGSFKMEDGFIPHTITIKDFLDSCSVDLKITVLIIEDQPLGLYSAQPLVCRSLHCTASSSVSVLKLTFTTQLTYHNWLKATAIHPT